MSRSYRKPYSAITGHSSAKSDKQAAARGVRRRLNQYVHGQHIRLLTTEPNWLELDYFSPDVYEYLLDDFLIPHRYECRHNDVWGWGRDGEQTLQTTSRYVAIHRTELGLGKTTRHDHWLDWLAGLRRK